MSISLRHEHRSVLKAFTDMLDLSLMWRSAFSVSEENRWLSAIPGV